MYTTNLNAKESILSLIGQLLEWGFAPSIAYGENCWGSYVAVSADIPLEKEDYFRGNRIIVDYIDAIYVRELQNGDKIMHHEWRFHYEFCEWAKEEE